MHNPLLEYWYRALRSEFGLRLEVSDQAAIMLDLYKARTETGDPALAGLELARMKNGEIWIVKKAAQRLEE